MRKLVAALAALALVTAPALAQKIAYRPGPTGVLMLNEEFWLCNVSLQGITSTVANSGVLGIATGEGFGVCTHTTGASTNASGGWVQQGGFVFGSGPVVARVRVKVSAVSDGSDTFTFWAGFNDVGGASLAGSGTDAVSFRYTHTENSGHWTCYARNNGSESGSTADSTIPVLGNTWYSLEIRINAAGTVAAFFIDGIQRCSITANIPTVAGRETLFQPYMILKSAGSTARLAYIDFAQLSAELTR